MGNFLTALGMVLVSIIGLVIAIGFVFLLFLMVKEIIWIIRGWL